MPFLTNFILQKLYIFYFKNDTNEFDNKMYAKYNFKLLEVTKTFKEASLEGYYVEGISL